MQFGRMRRLRTSHICVTLAWNSFFFLYFIFFLIFFLSSFNHRDRLWWQQHLHRRLQRSVNEMRKYVWMRPYVSVIVSCDWELKREIVILCSYFWLAFNHLNVSINICILILTLFSTMPFWCERSSRCSISFTAPFVVVTDVRYFCVINNNCSDRKFRLVWNLANRLRQCIPIILTWPELIFTHTKLPFA